MRKPTADDFLRRHLVHHLGWNGPLRAEQVLALPCAPLKPAFALFCLGLGERDGAREAALGRRLRRVLAGASRLGLTSLALPALGTGRGGLRRELAGYFRRVPSSPLRIVRVVMRHG